MSTAEENTSEQSYEIRQKSEILNLLTIHHFPHPFLPSFYPLSTPMEALGNVPDRVEDLDKESHFAISYVLGQIIDSL